LPETYEYLDKLEAYLGQAIVRLRSEHGFDHWLNIYGGYLPSARMRWCTKVLKIRPFERYIGEDDVNMYIGIRADEDRAGYRPTKPNIHPVYPFVDAGYGLSDVQRILDESGLGFPAYYSWRTRSGCYFCFYQQRHEWIGLKENHPQLFEKAKSYERPETKEALGFTWSQAEALTDLENPARQADIQRKAERRASAVRSLDSKRLMSILEEDDESAGNLPCSHCHI
jgi:3'-phosphoadenosine 5'-phosphosulfate sulfotransferase (PAPS reductase)/FAD synthetase